MSDEDQNARNDDCRLAVLQALTARASGSHTARAITTLYLRNHDFSLAEVQTHLELLKRINSLNSRLRLPGRSS
jgi:hypothetical protein